MENNNAKKNRFASSPLARTALAAAWGIFILASPVSAQSPEEKKGGGQKPPSPVVVSSLKEGTVRPMNSFVGTVYYVRVSDVAAEVAGRVAGVHFHEGDRVEAGAKLVSLDTEIMDTTIAATKAEHAQVIASYTQAKKELERITRLYKDKTVSESVYDDHFYKARETENKAAALGARLKRERIEKEKMTIRAPFAGVVLERNAEAGEWIAVGTNVAVLADESEIEVVVDVPESVLNHLEPDLSVSVTKGEKTFDGRLFAYIPEGDVATRTFPVKIRLQNPGNLMQGMEAEVRLPSAPPMSGLLVLRDAVLDKFGRTIIFVVKDNTAKMVPVTVQGYRELQVGISGPGLSAGMPVVVKGHERLRDGQPVRVTSQASKP